MSGTVLDLPDQLRHEGLTVYVVPQWRTNGHDGQLLLTDPWGHLLHHTADNAGLGSVWDPAGDRRPDVPQPRCNLWLPRAGDYDVAVVSAGRAYHAGTNSAVALADVRAGRINADTPDAYLRGLVDDSNGNGHLLGTEVENRGDGQPLTDRQLRALPRVCAAVARTFGLSTGQIAHHRQVTRRKPDMAWRGDIWSMTAAVLAGEEPDMPLTDADAKLVAKALVPYLQEITTGGGNATDNNPLLQQLRDAEDAKFAALTAGLTGLAGDVAGVSAKVDALTVAGVDVPALAALLAPAVSEAVAPAVADLLAKRLES